MLVYGQEGNRNKAQTESTLLVIKDNQQTPENHTFFWLSSEFDAIQYED
jgi:hypothetical protein